MSFGAGVRGFGWGASRPGLARPGVAWFGAGLEALRPGLARPGVAWPGLARPGVAWGGWATPPLTSYASSFSFFHTPNQGVGG